MVFLNPLKYYLSGNLKFKKVKYENQGINCNDWCNSFNA